MATGLAVEPGSGTATILARVARPFDAARFLAALLGLPQRAARQLVGVVLATSDEAEVLLDHMAAIVRSLSIATTDKPERCYGELRGPVLWSETMSARSASAGDPGLYVCSTTTKAYDTTENRVLKAALAAIDRAGRDATVGVDPHGDVVLRRARFNENRARHLLEHRTLSSVPVTRISGRALLRTRSGRRRNTYQPAVALLLRAHDPVRVDHLLPWLNDAVARDHDLLATTLAVLDRRTTVRTPLRTTHGALAAGPVRYDHLGGVTIGGVLVTAPDEIEPALDRANPAN